MLRITLCQMLYNDLVWEKPLGGIKKKRKGKKVQEGFFFSTSAECVGLALLISNVIPHQRKTKTLNRAGCPTFHISLSIVPHLLIRCLLVN